MIIPSEEGARSTLAKAIYNLVARAQCVNPERIIASSDGIAMTSYSSWRHAAFFVSWQLSTETAISHQFPIGAGCFGVVLGVCKCFL